jgi:hypothetical protein
LIEAGVAVGADLQPAQEWEFFIRQRAVVNGEQVAIASQAETGIVRIVPTTTKNLEWTMAF